MTVTASEHSADEAFEISDFLCLPVKPMVSVLMLAYNHGPYLAEAIEGVLKQRTDFPIELLIGEDCSTDNTREIAMRYQREYPNLVRTITSSSNVGGRRNRRRVARAVRGEFTAFCEGDDYWTDPAKLQLQVDYLRAHPDTGAVHSDFDRIIHRGGRWRILRRFQHHMRGLVPQGDIFPTLLAGNFIQTCTLCIRTDLDRQYLASGLPVESYPIGDWPLCLYIAAHSKIGYLDQSLAAYRKVPGSATNSGHLANLRQSLRCHAMIDDACKCFGIEDSIRATGHSALHESILSLAFLAGDMPAFETSWHWLEQNNPTVVRPWRRRFLRWVMSRDKTRRIVVRMIETFRMLREMRFYRDVP